MKEWLGVISWVFHTKLGEYALFDQTRVGSCWKCDDSLKKSVLQKETRQFSSISKVDNFSSLDVSSVQYIDVFDIMAELVLLHILLITLLLIM